MHEDEEQQRHQTSADTLAAGQARPRGDIREEGSRADADFAAHGGEACRVSVVVAGAW